MKSTFKDVLLFEINYYDTYKLCYGLNNLKNNIGGSIDELYNLKNMDLYGDKALYYDNYSFKNAQYILKHITIPKNIGFLKNLVILNAPYCQLDISMNWNIFISHRMHCYDTNTFPSEIGKLNNLQELHLHNNGLKTIPTEIGNMSNLKILSLHHNNIVTMPTQVGQLYNLTHLKLYKNNITNVPSELGNLYNLQHLDLQSNKLVTLPTEIANLSSLKVLDVSYNENLKLPFTRLQLYNAQIFY
jgi:hypothetical protein